MQEFRFYKESDDRWYIDIPQWTGDKADLEMVCGADTMLDLISNDEYEVKLVLSETKFDDAFELKFISLEKEMGNGAYYYLEKFDKHIVEMEIWLCDVTKFIFGEFPNVIYFKKTQ